MTDDENKVDYNKAQRILRPFSKRNNKKANFEFFFTVIMYWGGLAMSYYALKGETWLLAISLPVTVAFMCRSYVIEHDCGHLNFYQKARWNDIAGTILGFGITIPYSMWKFVHNSHHKNVGNLDRRDFNPEVWTMTITEFKQASLFKRTLYRIMRSRFTRLVIGPTINYGLACRLIHPNFSRMAIVSVLVHNVIYAIIIWFVISSIGFTSFFIIFLLPLIAFFGIAAYTFYGQHQFEDTYWREQEEWDWVDATSHGATDIQAPAWYRWLIGNVTYHTVHHLYVKIPFYNLHEAQKALNKEMTFKKIHITQVWQLLGLKLWDEDKKKLVSFKDAKIS